MAAVPFELRGVATDADLLASIPAEFVRVGLAGILSEPGPRARRARVPGGAVIEGYRWRLADCWDRRWWPQGIAVGDHEGTPLVIVSWYAQPRRGVELGSRISIVDLSDPARPRYHHVLLVAPQREGDRFSLAPVRIHAGGIVWTGDRLLVAATYDGFREFTLSDIRRVPASGPLARSSAGYRYVLPESASFTPQTKAKGRMRYSFLGLETRSSETPDASRLRLIAGEYGSNEATRLARLTLVDGGTTEHDTHLPAIDHMQGAVVHDGRWYVSASRGDKRNGDLWTGGTGNLVRIVGALPPGPEDVAAWPERNQLWSVSEYPGKRWIFAMPLES